MATITMNPTVVRETSLLLPISRQLGRDQIEIGFPLSFDGVDIWNVYELSWLNPRGLPQVALGEIHFPCTSANIIDSTSLKNYFNSLNQTPFDSIQEVQKLIERDLSKIIGCKVDIKLAHPHLGYKQNFCQFVYTCIDDFDFDVDLYTVNPWFLHAEGPVVSERLYSNLFKINSHVTGNPEWATVYIFYEGYQVDHQGLLKYLVSFREQKTSPEQCVEKIFSDIASYCHPEHLSVFAKFARQGGIEVNPFRSNYENFPPNLKPFR